MGCARKSHLVLGWLYYGFINDAFTITPALPQHHKSGGPDESHSADYVDLVKTRSGPAVMNLVLLGCWNWEPTQSGLDDICTQEWAVDCGVQKELIVHGTEASKYIGEC